MIYSRDVWQPKYGRGHATDGAKTVVVVHNDSTAFPSRAHADMTVSEEAELVRFYEDYHVNGEPNRVGDGLTHSNPRLAYQFVGFPSARVWEGIGWDHIGAHTAGMNSSAVGFFVPVNGNEFEPSDEFIAAFHDWRRLGVRLGKLAANHVVKGHSDYGKPSCPGTKLYDTLVRDRRPVELPRIGEIVSSHPSLRLGKGGKVSSMQTRIAVTYLQDRLSSMGFMNMPAVPGYFGPETDAGVRKLQVKHGLRKYEKGGTAIVGPATWKILDRRNGS